MITDRSIASPALDERPGRGLTFRSLRAFFALAFGLGWGIGVLMVVFSEQIESVFGELSGTNPVFILVVYSPAMAALIVVGRQHGAQGIRDLLRRLTLWRMPARWWVLLLLGIPAIKYLGAAFNGTAGEFPFDPWYEVIPALGLALIIGPVEEIGWRGVALPLLQRRYAPLWSALILGAFWGVWHLPAFLMSGSPQSGWDFGPFVVGVLALSVLVTPMFNAAAGSVLVAALFHFQMNNPAWPDAQPWENYLFAIAAVLVVVANRATMLRRGSGATDVLRGGET